VTGATSSLPNSSPSAIKSTFSSASDIAADEAATAGTGAAAAAAGMVASVGRGGRGELRARARRCFLLRDCVLLAAKVAGAKTGNGTGAAIELSSSLSTRLIVSDRGDGAGLGDGDGVRVECLRLLPALAPPAAAAAFASLLLCFFDA
jgi:hypothetical protein